MGPFRTEKNKFWVPAIGIRDEKGERNKGILDVVISRCQNPKQTLDSSAKVDAQ